MDGAQSNASREDADESGENVDVTRALINVVLLKAGAREAVCEEDQRDEDLRFAQVCDDLHVPSSNKWNECRRMFTHSVCWNPDR